MSFRNAFEEPSGGGGSGSHTILSATHTDTDETKAPVGGDLFKFAGGLWVPGRAVWDEVQDKPATFPPDDHGHDLATELAPGFSERNYSGADKGKLDGLTGQAVGTFWAYNTVNQPDIPSGQFVKVDLQAERFDVNGWFDTATSRYTVQKAGYYEFGGGVYIVPGVDQKQIYSILYKGTPPNAPTRHADIFINSTSGTSAAVAYGSAKRIYADVGDYFELWTYHTFGVNTSDIIAFGEFTTYFAGGFVGTV